MTGIAPARRNDLRQARELLRNLVSKELKVRYKQSVLGFAWSLVTPLLMTAIFTTVFAVFLRIPVNDFASYFLSGYLIWQFFSNSVTSSVGAIVGNGALIRKVYFPREVIPLSLVLSQAVHLGLALVAMSPLFLTQRGNFVLYLPAFGLFFLLLLAFTTGVSMLFAAINVTFRDLQELTQVIFLAWFYGTPVIYPMFLVEASAHPAILWLINANPMTWFVRAFQRILHGVPAPLPPDGAVDPDTVIGPGWPSLTNLWICAAWAVVALVVGWWMFHRRAVSFAKEV